MRSPLITSFQAYLGSMPNPTRVSTPHVHRVIPEQQPQPTPCVEYTEYSERVQALDRLVGSSDPQAEIGTIVSRFGKDFLRPFTDTKGPVPFYMREVVLFKTPQGEHFGPGLRLTVDAQVPLDAGGSVYLHEELTRAPTVSLTTTVVAAEEPHLTRLPRTRDDVGGYLFAAYHMSKGVRVLMRADKVPTSAPHSGMLKALIEGGIDGVYDYVVDSESFDPIIIL